jgi:PAS domain S-box-containing protein
MKKATVHTKRKQPKRPLVLKCKTSVNPKLVKKKTTVINENLLNSRNTGLLYLTNDLAYLFDSIEIPIVMIGTDGKIRRFTQAAARTIRLSTNDIGRPIADLKPDFDVINLEEMVNEVIKCNCIKEIETQNTLGHWYNLQIRPLIATDKKVEGAIILLLDIDKVKTNELRLQNAKKDALAIIEAQPIPLLIVDTNQRVRLANQSFYKNFRVIPAETEGRLLSELGSGQWNIPQLLELVRKTLQQNAYFEEYEVAAEFPHIGNKIMLFNAKQVQLGGSGEIVGILTIVDATTARSAEKYLRESEESFKFALEGAGDGTWDWNVRTGEVKFSNRFKEMIGFNGSEIPDRIEEWSNRIHPEDREKTMADLNSYLEGRTGFYKNEHRLLCKNGGWLWILDRGSTVEKDSSGTPLRMVGTHVDISEHKKTETALRESEEKFRNFLATAYDGIMIIDRLGIITYANQKLEKMFGYNAGELINQNYEILITDRDRPRHRGRHDEYMLSPQPRMMGRNLALIGKNKDGNEFPIDVALSPVKTKEEVYVNCMIRDISDVKRLEAEQKKMHDQIQDLLNEAVSANRIKDEFLATLSHELRTPLTTIQGWAQVLLAKELNENVKEGLIVIERSAQLQGQLINDLLDVSRIQSGKMAIDFQLVDLIGAIKLAINSVRNLAEKKSITIKTEIEPANCTISADHIRLQQVLWNLLTNAIKFTPFNGSISISLTNVSSDQGSMAQIKIRDTGIGIKPEFLPKIFKRFSQADSSMTRLHGGLGLGLSIVQSLTELQNGSITAASDGEGLGSTFTVSFPILISKNQFISEPAKISSHKFRPVRLDGRKVLIVDDNADNRLLFSVVIKSYGASVRLAETVTQALEILAEFKPDIILSDISMPEEDGYSLIRKVQKIQTNQEQKTPVVAVTAYAGSEDVRCIMESGFAAYIAKPVVWAQLNKILSELTGLKAGPPAQTYCQDMRT